MDFPWQERIADECEKIKATLTHQTREDASFIPEQLKNDILKDAHRTLPFSEDAANAFLSALFAEADRRPELKDQAPFYLHRFIGAKAEERIFCHARAAELIADTMAKAASVFLKNGRPISFVDGFLTLYAEGKTEEEFSMLPPEEKKLFFKRFTGAQENLLKSCTAKLSNEAFINAAEKHFPEALFGMNGTTEKIAELAERLSIDVSDEEMQLYEENCEPLLPVLGVVTSFAYEMANPLYPDFDLRDVRKLGRMITLCETAKRHEPADGKVAGIAFPKEASAFFSMEENQPTLGTVSAVFEGWMRSRYSAAVRFFDPQTDMRPLSDRDECTERLLNGRAVVVTEVGKEPCVLTADASTGQMHAVFRHEIPDLTSSQTVSIVALDALLELSKVKTTETAPLTEALRNLEKSAAEPLSARLLAVKKTVEAAEAFLLSISTSPKKPSEKTMRAEEVAKSLCKTLAFAPAVTDMEEAGLFEKTETSVLLAAILKKYTQKQEARQKPGAFSGEYGALYRKQALLLSGAEALLKESSVAEEKEPASETPRQPSESEDLPENEEDIDLRNMLMHDIQTDVAEDDGIDAETSLTGGKSISTDDTSPSKKGS